MANISDIRVYNIEGTGNLRAYASITLDDEYVVHGLKVMDSENGLWVSMPASKNKRGEFKDIFHPITREAREALITAVINAYEQGSSDAPNAAPVAEEEAVPEEATLETTVEETVTEETSPETTEEEPKSD